eukprot:989819-Rhodomonas_salina.1
MLVQVADSVSIIPYQRAAVVAMTLAVASRVAQDPLLNAARANRLALRGRQRERARLRAVRARRQVMVTIIHGLVFPSVCDKDFLIQRFCHVHIARSPSLKPAPHNYHASAQSCSQRQDTAPSFTSTLQSHASCL